MLGHSMKKNIALNGLASAGKDTAANEFIKMNPDYVTISFGSAVKDVCSALFGWDRAMLEGDTIESRTCREQVDEYWASKLDIPNFTPRKALQLIGTDVLRNHFNQSIWIYNVEKHIEDYNKQGKYCIITDMRMFNELVFVVNKDNFIKARIVRGNEPEWFYEASKLNKLVAQHNLQYWVSSIVDVDGFENLIEEKLNIDCNWLKVYKPHYSEWSIVGLINENEYIYNDNTKEQLGVYLQEFYNAKTNK